MSLPPLLIALCACAAACGSASAPSPPPATQATPAAPAAAAGSKPAGARFASVAAAIERGDAPKTTSVLAMRGGEIIYEGYFNGATADTLHDTRSVGKSITSLAIGAAIARGALPGVSARAFPYLADLQPIAHAGPLKDQITIEDLLTMSSALDCDDNDEKSPGNEENMYPLSSWARWAVDLPVRASYRRDATGRGPWAYCTAGTVLLGQILQRATKQPVDAFIAEHLFAPLGIQKWEFAKSPTGEIMTGGGLRLRTRDYAALLWMLRAGGRHNNTQVVPASYVKAALTVHRTAFPEVPQDYGYLLWHRTYHTRCGDFPAWFMAGNGGNALAIVESLDAVVAVTRTHYNQGRKMHAQTAAIIEQHLLPELAELAGTCRPPS